MAIFVSRSLDYAIRSLIHLAAAPDGRASLRQLSAGESVPRSYLAKLMRILVQAGLVESDAGSHGGYRLARPAEEISLLEIFEVVEGRFRTVSCTEDGDCDLAPACAQVPIWLDLEAKIAALLAEHRLSDFLAQRGRRHTKEPMVPLDSLGASEVAGVEGG